MRLLHPVLWGSLAVVAGVSEALSGQAPTFTAKVEVVRVDVLVTDSGRPLLDLTASDFEVFDAGVRQQIEHVSFDEIPVNLVLTLDMSDSVAGNVLAPLRAAGGIVLDRLRSGDQAALVAFNSSVFLQSPLTANLERIRERLNTIAGAGGTALIDAAYAAMLVPEGDPGRGILIVFSDGLDTSSWLAAARVLESAKRSDAVVYGAALGGTGRDPFLRQLTDATGGRVFDLASIANLGATFTSILEEFRHRYVLSYSPSGVAKAGWHKLEVRIKGRRAKVNARPGYLAGPG